MINKQSLIDRFIRYVKIDTTSDDNSTTFPSTKKQFDLANVLVKELETLGLHNISLDEWGYVMATLPANTDKAIPTIGFLAHMDTAPDMSGTNVNPRLIENYDGKDIVLHKENNVILGVKDFPELKDYIGQTLIVTDGTTLLGADDKAGIAEIMTSLEYMVNHPEFKHGKIRISFTVDEEIGRGADHFEVKKFNADFAYTMDGGMIGELEFENFNAAGAKVYIQGRNVHPGYAKNKMKNALHIAMEFNSLLPVTERPEHTQDYEGFYHLTKMEGDVENAMLQYIIRDHSREKFVERKVYVEKIANFISSKYGEGTIKLELTDQYFNMREMVEPVYHIVDTAIKAMEQVGVKPLVRPIRGGTDGARLSYMGLPCPNLFTGGLNYHGKYEFVPVDSMEKASEVMLKIIELYVSK
ncbi:MAG: peptidase T [Bacteroidales bacterium]|nr:MAG: peptidase T [Bacteroidales bacterium]